MGAEQVRGSSLSSSREAEARPRPIAELATAEEVWFAVLHLTEEFGFGSVAYEYAPFGSVLGRQHAVLYQNGFDDCFGDHGFDDAEALRDVLFRRAFLEVPPFYWSDVAEFDWLSDQAGDVKRLARSCDDDVVTVPVYGPNVRNGYFVFGLTSGKKPSALTLHRLQQRCQTLHLRLSEVEDSPLLKHVRLSGRERDVLVWLTRGKSNAETASILGISANTVDTHLRRVYAKLGVNDRVTAALVATGSGLVH